MWHCPGGGVAAEEWATEVAGLLLPGQLPSIERHRWMNSLGPLCEYALLCCVHNAFPRALAQWLSAGAEAAQGAGAQAATPGAWQLPPTPEEGDAPVEQPCSSVGDWQEFNKKQRKVCLWFARGTLGRHLLLARIAMQPQVRLLHIFEAVGSVHWEQQQWRAAAEGGGRSFPILEAHRGEAARAFFESWDTLHTDPATWSALGAGPHLQAGVPPPVHMHRKAGALSESLAGRGALAGREGRAGPASGYMGTQVQSMCACVREGDGRLGGDLAIALRSLPPQCMLHITPCCDQ